MSLETLKMTPVSLYNTAAGIASAKQGFHLAPAPTGPRFDAPGTAAQFVTARRCGGAFTQYPGTPPPDLAAAYRCQDEAISLWNDAIVGWKVGWIPEPLSVEYGAQRLVGPIFQRSLRRLNGVGTTSAGVFEHGFAAIEAEFVFELARDAPADIVEWSPETARALVKTLYVGVEIASSPLKDINDYGPAVIASDFGNNAGLLLGSEVVGWETRSLESLRCETRIDGEVVGRGSAAAVSGGPLAALAFVLGLNARRGRPLKAGELITTGAATGVHPIHVGQAAEAVFPGIDSIHCIVRSMTPVS
jgi:2-keto-4-pentenoate hydratase